MGRAKKDKPNYTEQFKRLYEEKGISGNADLLRKMYDSYYKNKQEISCDRQSWVKSQAPDFGKKITGERTFTESDQKAIERALDMSWVDIVEPLSEKPGKTKEFEQKGLRYAAYMDEERYYQELVDFEDTYRSVLFNEDEYEKTIIDYIIDNKAENGLRFLINEGYLVRDTLLKFKGVPHAEALSKKLWNWIITLDDPELFLKVWGEENFFNHSFDHEEKREIFLEKVVETKKIFEALCRERIHPGSELKYMPSLLFEALKFSLNRNKQVVAQRIISAYAKFIDAQTMAVQNDTHQESNNKLMARRCRHPAQIEIMRGESTVMCVWDFSELSKKYVGFEDQIEPLQISNILNRLEVKNLSAMEYGDSFVKEGIYYIKKEYDRSLEALKYLTEEKGCNFLPTYIGEESGVTKISAYKRDWQGIKFGELGEILGEIHLLSQEKLGADRVYMYSRGFANGFGRMLSGGTKVIINWEICDMGTPIRDIVTAFLNCEDTRGNFGEAYRRFIETKDESYQELFQFLSAYPDKRIIENFGDKFNEELDEMLKNETQGAQDKNTEIIEKLYMAKSFAEIYRNNLNLITRKDCEIRRDK